MTSVSPLPPAVQKWTKNILETSTAFLFWWWSLCCYSKKSLSIHLPDPITNKARPLFLFFFLSLTDNSKTWFKPRDDKKKRTNFGRWELPKMTETFVKYLFDTDLKMLSSILATGGQQSSDWWSYVQHFKCPKTYCFLSFICFRIRNLKTISKTNLNTLLHHLF